MNAPSLADAVQAVAVAGGIAGGVVVFGLFFVIEEIKNKRRAIMIAAGMWLAAVMIAAAFSAIYYAAQWSDFRRGVGR